MCIPEYIKYSKAVELYLPCYRARNGVPLFLLLSPGVGQKSRRYKLYQDEK